MNKEILSSVEGYFQKFGNIEFAILFGSYASGKESYLSDIDFGIYVKKELELLEQGLMIYELEALTNKKVDLIILNNLYKKNPEFAYNIVANCKLLLCRSQKSFIYYKTQSFLYYFDTEYLRQEVNETFLRRLNQGKFGEKNYVR